MVNLQFNYPSVSEEGALFSEFITTHPNLSSLLKAPAPFAETEFALLAQALQLPENMLQKKCTITPCSSGNGALFNILFALRKQPLSIGVEDFTYNGFRMVANDLGYTLAAVACDEQGMKPEAVKKAIDQGVKMFYMQPTIQNPTCRVMSEERRMALVSLIKENDVLILEDDAYRFLHPEPPPAFLSLLPEQTIRIFSLSKSFNSNSKCCFIIYPKSVLAQLPGVLRETGGNTTPFSIALAFYLLGQQRLETIIKAKQQEAATLQTNLNPLLRQLDYQTFLTSYHLWIRLPPQRSSKEVEDTLLEKGIAISGGHGFSVTGNTDYIRIALSQEKDVTILENAVAEVVQLAAWD